MADKEAVELSLGIDSKKFDAGLAKTKQKTEQAADGMGKAFGKFGFEMDGVLTKLARQLSLTDIAAAAVFAGIAKGQQVVRDSVKAYEDQQRALKMSGASYDEMIDKIDANSRAIKDNNASIGSNASIWRIWASDVEVALSNVTAKIVQFGKKNQEAADMMLTNSIARQFASKGLGAPTVTIGGSGGSNNAFVGPQVPDNLGEIRASQDAAARAREDMQRRILESERSFRFSLPGGDMPEFGRNRRSFMGGGGFAEGATSDLGGTMEELERQRIEYEKGLDSQAAAMERANEQLTAFSNNIGYGLVNALFQGQNAVDALKNAVMSMVQDFLGQLVSGGIKSVLGSIVPGLGLLSAGGGGRTVGTAPSPQALEFYRGVVAPAMAYEQRRGR